MADWCAGTIQIMLVRGTVEGELPLHFRLHLAFETIDDEAANDRQELRRGEQAVVSHCATYLVSVAAARRSQRETCVRRVDVDDPIRVW